MSRAGGTRRVGAERGCPSVATDDCTFAAAECEVSEKAVSKEGRMQASVWPCAAAGTRLCDARDRGCRTEADRKGGGDRALIPR